MGALRHVLLASPQATAIIAALTSATIQTGAILDAAVVLTPDGLDTGLVLFLNSCTTSREAIRVIPAFLLAMMRRRIARFLACRQRFMSGALAPSPASRRGIGPRHHNQ